MRPSTQFVEPQVFSAEDQARLERATVLHGGGHLAEAETIYTELLSAPGAKVAVLCFVLGLLKSQMGEPVSALDWYDEAAVHGHDTVDLHANRADILRQAGRRVDALAAYEKAIAHRADLGALHIGAGLVLAELGRTSEALSAYDRALALDPINPRLHNNRGVALEKLDRDHDAIDAYVSALRIDPVYRHAHHNLGSVLLKLEQFDMAAESLERALQLDASAPESWNLFGMAMIELERYPEALEALERAVSLRPLYAEAYNNLSVALRRSCRFTEAVAAAEQAFALDSTLVEALSSRGLALTRLCRFEEAVFDFNAAKAARPRTAKFVLNRGVAREGLGDVLGAIEDFQAAEALDPELPDAKLNRALAALRMGDYAQGWPLYEHRWKDRFGPFLPYPREKLWLGEGDIAGKTVLLWGEQGFGDAIQFCRFATDLTAMGAKVVVQVSLHLVRLMERLLGPERVISSGDTPPAFDLFTPFMSLPLALGLPGPAAVRRGVYLSADPEDVAAWGERLKQTRKLRIGLAWSGNPGHENDHNRSMPFAAYKPILNADFEFVSLQKVHTREDDAAMMAAGVEGFDDYLHDFGDTAALIAQCDAVVAVDTSVAHLAAAMGKPTFFLIAHFADWRWGDKGEDTPWYPHARLLRQRSAGEWGKPMAAALDALTDMALVRRLKA